MLYVQLDTNWPDHPKIIRAGIDGAGLHALILCLVAQSTDGLVSVEALLDRGVSIDLLRRLVFLELIVAVDDHVSVPSVRIGGMTRAHIPTVIRQRVMDRDGHACVFCAVTDDLTLDHIVPWSHGGPDIEENLRVLCRPCNSKRGNRV